MHFGIEHNIEEIWIGFRWHTDKTYGWTNLCIQIIPTFQILFSWRAKKYA